MKSRTLVMVGMLVSLAFVCVSGRAVAQDAKAKAPAKAEAAAKAEAPSGQYKIGIVDQKRVLGGYTKVKEQYEKLQAEVDAKQKSIDAVSEQIQKAKDDYEKNKANMSLDEQRTKEGAIQSQFLDYQAELRKQQAEIDTKERILMEGVVTEIKQVVSEIGDAEGYHIILASKDTLYYTPTIDITEKVVDKLNSKAK